MFNFVPWMKCLAYWLVTYIRMKRKDRPFIFIQKFLREKIKIFHNCQLKISKKVILWCPGALRVLYIWGPGALQALFIWVPGALRESKQSYMSSSGTQIKSTRSAPGPQIRSTWCDLGHQIMTILLLFNCQLWKIVIFSLRNFSMKVKGLSFLLILV